MARIKITIDQQSGDIWDPANRRALLNTSTGIESLDWSYKVAGGGYWDGKIQLYLDPSGKSYDWLVRLGLVGVARIWWIRDATDAAGVDDRSELLWLGIAEDAKSVKGSDLVEFRLRGVGQFLEDILISRTFDGEKIGAAVQTVFDDVIAAVGSPVTAKDVELDGSCQRRVTMDFDRVPASRVLKDLAAQAGGPQRVAWGLRTGTDSDDQAIGYFKLWKGHLWEKDPSVEERVFTIPSSALVKKEVTTEVSDIVNVVTVIGSEIPQHEDSAERKFFTATAEAEDSVLRHGRREEVIEDSDLKSDGQCALLAAATLKEKANRSVEVSLELLLDLSNSPTALNETRGVIQHTLKWPGTLTAVRDGSRPFSAWGDTREVYSAQRDTADKSYLSIDTSKAPTGNNAPMLDLTSPFSAGEKRLTWGLMRRPSMVTPSVGVGVLELDRGVGLGWIVAGADWKLAILKRISVHSWVLIASSPAVRTSAELAKEHLVGLSVEYFSATQFQVSAYHYDLVNGAVEMVGPQIMNHTSISSEAGTDRIYVNAVASNGIDSFAGAVNGDSQDCDIAYVGVLRNWSGSTTSLLANIGFKHFPFKLYGDLVLLTNFGQKKSGKGIARFAYNQTERAFGFFATPKGDSTKSKLNSNPLSFASIRSYSWLLGNGLGKKLLGTHLEVLPVKSTIKYGGPNAPLSVKITGKTGARLITDSMRSLNDRLNQSRENARAN